MEQHTYGGVSAREAEQKRGAAAGYGVNVTMLMGSACVRVLWEGAGGLSLMANERGLGGHLSKIFDDDDALDAVFVHAVASMFALIYPVGQPEHLLLPMEAV